MPLYPNTMQPCTKCHGFSFSTAFHSITHRPLGVDAIIQSLLNPQHAVFQDPWLAVARSLLRFCFPLSQRWKYYLSRLYIPQGFCLLFKLKKLMRVASIPKTMYHVAFDSRASLKILRHPLIRANPSSSGVRTWCSFILRTFHGKIARPCGSIYGFLSSWLIILQGVFCKQGLRVGGGGLSFSSGWPVLCFRCPCKGHGYKFFLPFFSAWVVLLIVFVGKILSLKQV